MIEWIAIGILCMIVAVLASAIVGLRYRIDQLETYAHTHPARSDTE